MIAMAVAYIQSIGGASGDMLLGALVDCGVPLDILRQELYKLNIDGYDLSMTEEIRCEVRGTKVTVNIQDDRRRSPQELYGIVVDSSLPAEIKDLSCQVLGALFAAESHVHGESIDALQLEEIGTLDTLVDVVGVISSLAYLDVRDVYASPLVLGSARPPQWHNGYSVPAPATLELVAAAGAPIVADLLIHEGAGELTTPTGAALITQLARFSRPTMSLNKIGVGLGYKDPSEFPNALRLWLGDVDELEVSTSNETVVLLETNMDDITGMALGYVQEQLFDMGALDVWYTNIQMKKNRPGILLSVLVSEELEFRACELILRETTTLGIRTRSADRYVAKRSMTSMSTEYGDVGIKIKFLSGIPVAAAPEYEDCRRISIEQGISFQEIYTRAVFQARRQFLEP